MTEAKKGRVEIKVGNLSFMAEGEQEWLAEQLRKVMAAAAPAIASPSVGFGVDESSGGKITQSKPGSVAAVSLAAYLRSAGGESKQVQRFLATAGWLHRRGSKNLTTAMVSSALSENHQKRLGNPADCLNQNVSKGYCEKQKDGFFITSEGWKALGEEVVES